MKRHAVHSGSCSCTNCVYRSRSKDVSVQKLIADGSRIDRLYYGKYLPLRERKLLEKLIRTRAVYDDVRSQLLSGSDSSRISIQENEISNKSSAISEIVDMVDRGQLGSANTSKLSTCCNCCSCSSLKKIKKGMDKHPPVHRHNIPYEDIAKYSIEAEKRGRARRSSLSARIGKKTKNMRRKAKRARSEPCICTFSLKSLLGLSSKALVKKLHAEEIVTSSGKIVKVVRKETKALKDKICSCSCEHGKHPKPDSLTLHKERLKRNKIRDQDTEFEEIRRTKYRSKFSETERERDRLHKVKIKETATEIPQSRSIISGRYVHESKIEKIAKSIKYSMTRNKNKYKRHNIKSFEGEPNISKSILSTIPEPNLTKSQKGSKPSKTKTKQSGRPSKAIKCLCKMITQKKSYKNQDTQGSVKFSSKSTSSLTSTREPKVLTDKIKGDKIKPRSKRRSEKHLSESEKIIQGKIQRTGSSQSEISYMSHVASAITSSDLNKRLPFPRECEPSMCIPYECDPEECAKILLTLSRPQMSKTVKSKRFDKNRSKTLHSISNGSEEIRSVGSYKKSNETMLTTQISTRKKAPKKISKKGQIKETVEDSDQGKHPKIKKSLAIKCLCKVIKKPKRSFRNKNQETPKHQTKSTASTASIAEFKMLRSSDQLKSSKEEFKDKTIKRPNDQRAVSKSIASETYIDKPILTKTKKQIKSSKTETKYDKIKQRSKKRRKKGASMQINSTKSIQSDLSYMMRGATSEISDIDNNKRLPFPRECEPSMCIPYECDPEECAKILLSISRDERSDTTARKRPVKNRLKKYKSTGSSVVSIGQKSRRIQSRSTESSMKNNSPDQIDIIEKNIYPRKQAVRLSSSFSFGIEIYKDKAPKKSLQAESHSYGSKKKDKERKRVSKKYKNRHLSARTTQMRHTSSQSMSLQSIKNIQAGSNLKRCFCTMELYKKRHKKQQIRHFESKKVTANIPVKYFANTYGIKKTQTKNSEFGHVYRHKSSAALLPYEKILLTSKHTSTAGPKKSPIKMTSEIQTKSSIQTQSNNNKVKRRKISTLKKREFHQALKSRNERLKRVSASPIRQGIRLGSSFSFNIEFYKDKTITGNNNTLGYNVPSKKVTTVLKHKGIKVHKSRKEQSGIQVTKLTTKKRHWSQQKEVKMKSENTNTKSFIQRCFCTRQLFKKGYMKKGTNNLQKNMNRQNNLFEHLSTKPITANRARIIYLFEQSKFFPNKGHKSMFKLTHVCSETVSLKTTSNCSSLSSNLKLCMSESNLRNRNKSIKGIGRPYTKKILTISSLSGSKIVSNKFSSKSCIKTYLPDLIKDADTQRVLSRSLSTHANIKNEKCFDRPKRKKYEENLIYNINRQKASSFNQYYEDLKRREDKIIQYQITNAENKYYIPKKENLQLSSNLESVNSKFSMRLVQQLSTAFNHIVTTFSSDITRAKNYMREILVSKKKKTYTKDNRSSCLGLKKFTSTNKLFKKGLNFSKICLNDIFYKMRPILCNQPLEVMQSNTNERLLQRYCERLVPTKKLILQNTIEKYDLVNSTLNAIKTKARIPSVNTGIKGGHINPFQKSFFVSRVQTVFLNNTNQQMKNTDKHEPNLGLPFEYDSSRYLKSTICASKCSRSCENNRFKNKYKPLSGPTNFKCTGIQTYKPKKSFSKDRKIGKRAYKQSFQTVHYSQKDYQHSSVHDNGIHKDAMKKYPCFLKLQKRAKGIKTANNNINKTPNTQFVTNIEYPEKEDNIKTNTGDTTFNIDIMNGNLNNNSLKPVKAVNFLVNCECFKLLTSGQPMIFPGKDNQQSKCTSCNKARKYNTKKNETLTDMYEIQNKSESLELIKQTYRKGQAVKFGSNISFEIVFDRNKVPSTVANLSKEYHKGPRSEIKKNRRNSSVNIKKRRRNTNLQAKTKATKVQSAVVHRSPKIKTRSIEYKPSFNNIKTPQLSCGDGLSTACNTASMPNAKLKWQSMNTRSITQSLVPNKHFTVVNKQPKLYNFVENAMKCLKNRKPITRNKAKITQNLEKRTTLCIGIRKPVQKGIESMTPYSNYNFSNSSSLTNKKSYKLRLKNGNNVCVCPHQNRIKTMNKVSKTNSRLECIKHNYSVFAKHTKKQKSKQVQCGMGMIQKHKSLIFAYSKTTKTICVGPCTSPSNKKTNTITYDQANQKFEENKYRKILKRPEAIVSLSKYMPCKSCKPISINKDKGYIKSRNYSHVISQRISRNMYQRKQNSSTSSLIVKHGVSTSDINETKPNTMNKYIKNRSDDTDYDMSKQPRKQLYSTLGTTVRSIKENLKNKCHILTGKLTSEPLLSNITFGKMVNSRVIKRKTVNSENICPLCDQCKINNIQCCSVCLNKKLNLKNINDSTFYNDVREKANQSSSRLSKAIYRLNNILKHTSQVLCTKFMKIRKNSMKISKRNGNHSRSKQLLQKSLEDGMCDICKRLNEIHEEGLHKCKYRCKHVSNISRVANDVTDKVEKTTRYKSYGVLSYNNPESKPAQFNNNVEETQTKIPNSDINQPKRIKKVYIEPYTYQVIQRQTKQVMGTRNRGTVNKYPNDEPPYFSPTLERNNVLNKLKHFNGHFGDSKSYQNATDVTCLCKESMERTSRFGNAIGGSKKQGLHLSLHHRGIK